MPTSTLSGEAEWPQVAGAVIEAHGQDIQRLMESDDPEEIRAGMMRLGYSVEKAFLADRLRQLTREEA